MVAGGASPEPEASLRGGRTLVEMCCRAQQPMGLRCGASYSVSRHLSLDLALEERVGGGGMVEGNILIGIDTAPHLGCDEDAGIVSDLLEQCHVATQVCW